MKIAVDVMGEMNNVRATFSDLYCFVDEAIQNWQRSARETDRRFIAKCKIDRATRSVTFEDNGLGVSSWDDVFTKSRSGWKKSADENAFGAGFFSVVAVADEACLYSGNQCVAFDIRKMFREQTLDVLSRCTVPGRPRKGFKLEIFGIRQDVNLNKVEERVKTLARFMPFPIYFGGGILTRFHKGFADERLMETYADTRFKKLIALPQVEGFVALSRYWFPGVEIWYQRRPVQHITVLHGIKGMLHFKNGEINVRMPDRKEIIKDEQFEKLNDFLRSQLKELALYCLVNGSDREIESLDSVLKENVSQEDAEKHLRFLMASDVSLDEGCQPELEEIVDGSRLVSQISNQIALPSNEGKDGIPLDQIKAKRVFIVTREDLDAPEMVARFTKAKYHNVPVIVIRNRLEQHVLENQERFIVCQLEDFDTAFSIDVEVGDCFQNEACRKLSEYFKLKVQIADFTTIKRFADSYIAEKNKTAVLTQSGTIYLQKKDMVALNDPRDFILRNIAIIAHELAHALYGTEDGTVEHYQKEETLISLIGKQIDDIV